MKLFRRLTGKRDAADLFYYAYHGFLLRRRRVPAAAGDFADLARLALKALAKPRARRARASRLARVRRAGRGALLLHGCTTLRIIRHRDPDADRPRTLFEQRVVHRPVTTTPWVEAAVPRTDLDTLRVRDVDLAHAAARRVPAPPPRARVPVVRDDTILYERYAEGYGPATTSSSFSVAKSVTSALLGRVLQSGAIRSLDDSVTRYVPELARNPAYRGVTLRHLLEMRSGIAYTRTNGHAWHDLRSSDAHFFYTSNLDRAIEQQDREDPRPALGLQGQRRRAARLDPGPRHRRIDRAAARGGCVDADGGRVRRQLGPRSEGRTRARRVRLERDRARPARFGRLYLDQGRVGDVAVLPREWVEASTTRDTTRVEPEVVTWWQMQHQHFWWIPLQNWEAERDFFADGSRGQRIYVHPRSRLVIVQLANDSRQDFLFRAVVHHLMGSRSCIRPASLGSCCAPPTERRDRTRFAAGIARSPRDAREHPARYVISEAGMIATGERLLEQKGRRRSG